MDALNKNELEAMRVLWALREAKPAEIEDGFAWPIDNGTLRSVLKVLMEKDLVVRRKVGKAYFYLPKKSREGVLSRMTRQMAEIFAGGSAADLIAQLIKTEKLSPQDLAELRRIAGAKTSSNQKRSERGS